MNHKPRRRPARDIEQRNPVAIAIAKARMANVLREQRIAMYLMADGEDGTTALAAIGWALAMGAQTAAWVLPLDHPTLRRQHGSLRSVHHLCLAGYHWDASQTLALDVAIGEAHELLLAHPHYAQAATPYANHLADLIHAHRVQPDTIVGAELYHPIQSKQTEAQT